ncbi:hypothetical protein PIB30_030107 [Stylosanthes scabra]|uniref:Uncharacterized protein n=1 Tax=Stylosanthes scabra TaxID=79078 RepID=A0ABU6XD67_9FABA|nr:hypothetical protein [Stylosanthes scabra]
MSFGFGGDRGIHGLGREPAMASLGGGGGKSELQRRREPLPSSSRLSLLNAHMELDLSFTGDGDEVPVKSIFVVLSLNSCFSLSLAVDLSFSLPPATAFPCRRRHLSSLFPLCPCVCV